MTPTVLNLIHGIRGRLILLVTIVMVCSLYAPFVSTYVNSLLTGETRYIHIEGIDSDDQINEINQRLTLLDPQVASIAQIKSGLEELGWIHDVSVRKVWPDKLHILVVEQIPLAHWNDADFLNNDGEVFASSYINQATIPSLKGPSGAERLVMWQFQKLNKVVSTTGESISSLELSDRGSWSFVLGGVSVRLGKEDILKRMRRFLRVYKEVDFSDKLFEIAEIDTRYPNGIAVKWKTGRCQADCYADNHNLKRDITL
jgi:cell division septal protein FtsQ